MTVDHSPVDEAMRKVCMNMKERKKRNAGLCMRLASTHLPAVDALCAARTAMGACAPMHDAFSGTAFGWVTLSKML